MFCCVDSRDDVGYSCLESDPGVSFPVSQCYTKHDPLHLTLRNPEHLHLGAESNVALGKTASSSSAPASWGPEKAVDGFSGTTVSGGDECTHTDNVYQPWWKVDLEDIYTVNRVSVLNRGDCCGERLRNFMVRIGLNEDFTRNDQFRETYTATPPNGATVVVYCDKPMAGRYVSIQLIGRSDHLQLCEVDVFAETDYKDVFQRNHSGAVDGPNVCL
ncbi:PREDICTED: fucolectin-1-like [Branchiostoma belcheri]|uniref:Fucolectin-1-like n=1 Tax=Branchiostoma belcheri TaxID=7741 RepID=A0A6P4YLL7_BRABE|nr:PREDICTED: fucolectin-1-like [Branchiostoma belcheri]